MTHIITSSPLSYLFQSCFFQPVSCANKINPPKRAKTKQSLPHPIQKICIFPKPAYLRFFNFKYSFYGIHYQPTD